MLLLSCQAISVYLFLYHTGELLLNCIDRYKVDEQSLSPIPCKRSIDRFLNLYGVKGSIPASQRRCLDSGGLVYRCLGNRKKWHCGQALRNYLLRLRCIHMQLRHSLVVQLERRSFVYVFRGTSVFFLF